MHGGYIGVHFEKSQTVHKDVHQVEHLLWKRNASKYVNLLLNLVIFSMLAAILKNKVYEDAHKVEQILWGENVSTYENLIF